MHLEKQLEKEYFIQEDKYTLQNYTAVWSFLNLATTNSPTS